MMINMKKQYLCNSQYARREYLWVTGIPDAIWSKDAEKQF